VDHLLLRVDVVEPEGEDLAVAQPSTILSRDAGRRWETLFERTQTAILQAMSEPQGC
jgi:hypothetical protein